MGQVYGVPELHPGFSRFAYLPREAIESVWTSYNLLGEGWSLDIESMKNIFNNATYLVDDIGFSLDQLIQLFKALDTDNNNLIDALELFVILAVVSGMDVIDKINFVFSAYDFSGKGSLTPDELTLLLKTVGKGLAKICPCNPILVKTSDSQIEEYRTLIFCKYGMEASDGYLLTVDRFQNYCTSHPVVNSWIIYFTKVENNAVTRDMIIMDCASSVDIQSPLVLKGINTAKYPHKDIFDVPEPVLEVTNIAEGVDEVKENTPADELKNEEVPGEDDEEDKLPPAIVRAVNYPYRSWFALADIGRPEEFPAGRVDAPQDTIDAIWTHGVSSHLRRNVFYDNSGNIITLSSRSITIMSKNEENIWSQKCVSDHQYPITGIAFDSSGKIAVTADAIDLSCFPVSNNASFNDEAIINIWDTRNYDILDTIRVPNFPGIQYIDISSNGKLVVAVMYDAMNTVVVFEIVSRRAIFSKALGPDEIFDVRFAESETIFAVASTSHLTFFVNEGSTYIGNAQLVSYETRPAILQEIGKVACGISIIALSKFVGSDDMIAGTSTGILLFFRGRNCIQLIQLHEGSINTIHFNSRSESIVTCGDDGKVNILKLEQSISNVDTGVQKKGPKFNVKRSLHVLMKLDVLVNSGILNKQLRSVCIHDSSTKVLASCLSGELLEMSSVEGEAVVSEAAASENPDEAVLSESASLPSSNLGKDINGGPILNCHANTDGPNAITGLCKIPGGFVSCGSDGTLRMYQAGDGAAHRCMMVEKVHSSCSAITSTFQNIFISLDGSQNLCGIIKIYAISDWKFLHLSDVSVSPEYPICDIKVSSDGNLMIAASKNNIIYVLGFTEGVWSSKGIITLNAQPLRIDLSSDALYIRSLDVDEDVKVFTTTGTDTVQFGADVNTPSVLKSISWSTNSFPCTWDVKSLWTSVSNAKSMIITDRTQSLFVIGNTDGTLSMARVPGSQYDSSCYESIPIHCGAVGAVLFIEEGSRLVTAGAYDGQVKVWKVNYDIEELEVEVTDEVQPEPDGESEVNVVEYDSAEDEDLLDGDEMLRHVTRNLRNGDKLSAVKSWIEDFGTKATSINDGSNDPTINDELTVDWVFGYSSRTVKGAVRYNSEGLIVYPAATMGILYDKTNSKQSVIQLCYDQITCMEVHAKSGIAATSHKGGGNIIVTIWDTLSVNILSRLSCGLVNGVSSLSFSSDSVLLAIACQDLNHTVLVFNWQTGQLRSSIKGGKNKIICMNFNSIKDNIRILHGGIKHFNVLELRNRRTLNSKIGLYGAGVKKLNVICCASIPLPIEGGNEFIMGMDNGSLGVIARGDRRVSNFIPVQTGKITSLCVVVIKEATLEEPPIFRVITAGTNGIIKVLDQEFQPTMEYNLYSKDYGLNPVGKIRGFSSVFVDKACRKILYGTSAGEIGEIYFDNGNNVNEGAGPLITSHFKDQLHAIVPHPNRQECITIGEDKTLRVWNLETKKMLTMIELPDIARCACFSPNGQIIVVGLGGSVYGKNRPKPRPNNGHVIFLSCLQGKLNIIHSTINALDCITCVSFTSDGIKLYAASMDFNVYVYDALNNFDLCATFQGHSVGIRYMDLSIDGKYMLTTGVTGESILTDVEKNKIIPKGARGTFLNEIKWVNRKNICGIDSVGVFSSYNDFSDVTAISISKDATIMASSDVFGNVKILKNPSPNISSSFKEYHGHSVGGVSNVCFTVADKYLLSIGKDDKTIIQWRVTKSNFCENYSSNIKSSVPSGENGSSPQLSGNFFESFVINDINFIPESFIDTNISGSIKMNSLIGTNNKIGDNDSSFVSMYNSSGEVLTNYRKHITFLKDGTINKIIPFSNVISSMRMSSCGQMLVIATTSGDTGILSVYQANDCSLIVQLSDQIVGGISSCAISTSGMYISCIGNDSQHSLYVFESLSGTWYSDALQLHSSGCSIKITSHLSFMNHNGSKASNFFLCTASDNILKFWTRRCRDMNVKIGESVDIIPTITSLVSLAQIVYSGHSDGSIRSWVDGEYKNIFTFHQGDMISALKAVSTSSIPVLISGSSDGINILNADSYGGIHSHRFISIASVIKSLSRDMMCRNTAVASIDVDSFNNRILLSIQNGSIAELAVDGEANLLIVDGFDSSLVSSINHPTQPSIFVSAHADNCVRVWNTSLTRRILVGYLKLSHSISVLTFKDDKTIIACTYGGDNAGNSASIFVLQLEQILTENVGQPDPSVFLYQLSFSSKVPNVGSGSIQQIKLSPDKKLLAAASTDGNVYFYDEIYTLLGKVPVFPSSAGTSPVGGIDFSVCSRYVRCFGISSGSKNAIPVKFFDLQQETVDESSDFGSVLNNDSSKLIVMRDVKWSSISSAAAPEARGIMRKGVNVTSISSNSENILVGYTDGTVSLFKLPVYSESSNSIQIDDFSGPVIVNFNDSNSFTVCSISDGFIGFYSLKC